MLKNNYLNFFYAILSILFILACSHKQTSSDFKTVESTREPTSANDKIKLIDLNIKTGDSASYIEFEIQKDLTALENHVQTLLQQSNDQKKNAAKKEKQLTMESALKFNAVDKGYRAGLKNIIEQIRILKTSNDEFEKSNAIYKINLISIALQNKYITPIKTNFEATLIPIYILKYTYNQKIDKENIGIDSKTNPDNSLLWTNQFPKISKFNLYSYRYKKIEQITCDYEKAKTGWGIHPGFHIGCGKEIYKLKFGNELYSGPFNSRMYLALGYNSSEINYVNSVNVNYDRKMFTDFNLRKGTDYSVTVLGQKVTTFQRKSVSDLFDYALEFVLTNGQHINAKEFKKKLLNSEVTGRSLVDSDFNTQTESSIDYVKMGQASITTKTDDIEIGPWKLDDLDFTKKREFRALLILSAWLGNFDIRMDNNRLIQVTDQNNQSSLKLNLVDVGAGLGNSNSALSVTSSAVNDMSWTVTQTFKDGGDETEVKDRLQMIGFMTLELNKTFEKVQLNDAKWMLRQMCQVSKEQLTQALMASGLSSAGIKLAEAKLLNRRNTMIKDFEMQSELQSSCYSQVDKKFSYDPKLDGYVEITSATGEKIIASDSNEVIKKGFLVSK
ncbi:MAG: hypothetical protein WA160_12290 [Pseudobdellovibrio sp.]